MEILKYNQFITERLKSDSVDPNTLKVLKRNLLDRLKEYKEYILKNIFFKNGKVYYSDFDNIDIRVIIRGLNNEFTEEFINDYKIRELLEYINDQMKGGNNDVKNNIRQKFYDYFKLLS